MKICLKCKKEKELDEFNKNKTSKDGYQSYCKSCKKEIDIDSLDKDPKRRENQKERNKKYRNWYEELKQTLSCEKCGENRWYVLDFHHKDPKKKEIAIGSFRAKGYSREQIEKEIKKCIPLCKNCHKEFHYLEYKDKITIKQYLNKRL